MQQQELFSEQTAPPHIKLIADFISEAEEKLLLRRFRNISWQQIKMHGVTARRRVAHYGVDYTYTKRAVTQDAPPPPEWLTPLMRRAAKLIDKKATDLEEVLVTYYPKGSGIGWHKDAEVFGDAIIGISFLSDCTMKFKNPESGETFKLAIPRRSAYVFSGPVRWQWHHSITSHAEDRYSITFRTLRRRNQPAV